MIKTKGKISHNDIDVSQLKVFISYKTEEWDFASKIYYGLKKNGFQVFIDRYDLNTRNQQLSKNELRSILTEAISSSDFICFVTSNDSIKSEWISYEFREAAIILGRVFFICNGYKSVVHPGDKFMSKFSFFDFPCLITIKHTTLMFSNPTEKNINTLSVELINDPDEYWSDGVFFLGSRNYHLSLKQEITRKKFARKMVLNDPQFKGLCVNDVIPFDWEEAGCEVGEVDKARMWVVFDCGRKHLSRGLSEKEVEAKFVSYKTEEKENINAFVVVPTTGYTGGISNNVL